MKNINRFDSKKRLFEVYNRVNNIETSNVNNDINAIIDEFVDYVNNEINLNNEKPTISIIDDSMYVEKHKSFGGFNPNNNEITVVIKNRNGIDILRTIAHELVHYKQNQLGILNAYSGETGSEEENVANAAAGIIMRKYGKLKPELYNIIF
jgi:Zn-dependent peptidase ImmA (M78 family)